MIKFVGKGPVDAIEGMKRLGVHAPLAVRRSLTKAAREYQKGIQSAIPMTKTPGHNRENIVSAIGYKVQVKKGEVVMAKVGINIGKKNPRRRIKGGESVARFNARKAMIKPFNLANPVAHLLVLGTMDRWTGKRTWKTRSGKVQSRSTGNPRLYRGRVRGYPFVVRGVMNADASVKRQFPQWLQKEIEKELGKRGR